MNRMMKPALLLRVAAVLTFIHAVLHTIGGVFSEPEPGAGTIAVLAMKVNQFPLMGHLRSYWDFYRGLGLAVTIFLTAEAILFWQLSSLINRDGQRLRPILGIFLVGYLVLAVNSYAYFFFGPVIVEVLIAACLGLAFITTKPEAASHV